MKKSNEKLLTERNKCKVGMGCVGSSYNLMKYTRHSPRKSMVPKAIPKSISSRSIPHIIKGSPKTHPKIISISKKNIEYTENTPIICTVPSIRPNSRSTIFIKCNTIDSPMLKQNHNENPANDITNTEDKPKPKMKSIALETEKRYL